MKQFLTIFAILFVGLSLRAQDSIQVTHNSWAGGVCCSSGDDFTLNLPYQQNHQNVDSIWIFLPGYRIHLSDKQLKSSNKNCTATFGWSSNRYSNDLPTANFYGINTSDLVYLEDYSNESYATLFLSNGKQKSVPVKYTFTITAYP